MRFRAFLFVELAISMVVCGLLTLGVWKAIKVVQNKFDRIRVIQNLDEISRAASDYARRNGYLPLPEEAEEPNTENPDDWRKLKLRGEVPWKELGLVKRPLVSGSPFTWVVSTTAIRRPGWEYQISNDRIHNGTRFWLKNKTATFAFPKWYGIYTKARWGDVVPGQSYAIRVVQALDTKDQVPKIRYLSPYPPRLFNMGKELSYHLQELYELEKQVRVLLRYDAEAQEFSPFGSKIARIQFDEELRSGAVEGRMMSAVWIDEPVLAVAYKPYETDEQLDVMEERETYVWTREGLLRLTGYTQNLLYEHPGYYWTEPTEIDAHEYCDEEVRKGTPNIDNTILYFKLKKPPTQEFKDSDNYCAYLHIDRESYIITRIERIKYIAGETGGVAINYCPAGSDHGKFTFIAKAIVLKPIEDNPDLLVSSYLLEWGRAILHIGNLQPLRISGSGIQPTRSRDSIIEFFIWKEQVIKIKEVFKRLAEWEKEERQKLENATVVELNSG